MLSLVVPVYPGGLFVQTNAYNDPDRSHDRDVASGSAGNSADGGSGDSGGGSGDSDGGSGDGGGGSGDGGGKGKDNGNGNG